MNDPFIYETLLHLDDMIDSKGLTEVELALHPIYEAKEGNCNDSCNICLN